MTSPSALRLPRDTSVLARSLLWLGLLVLAGGASPAPAEPDASPCASGVVGDIVEILERIHAQQFCEDFLYPPDERVTTTTSTTTVEVTRRRGVSTYVEPSFIQRLATTTFFTDVPTQTVTKSRFTATETFVLPRPIVAGPENEKRDDKDDAALFVPDPSLVLRNPVGFPLLPPYFDRVVNDPSDLHARADDSNTAAVPNILQSNPLASISAACSCLPAVTSPDPTATRTVTRTSRSITTIPTTTTTTTTVQRGQPATLALHLYRGSTTTTQTLAPSVFYIEPIPSSLIARDCPYFIDNGFDPDPYAYVAAGGTGTGNRVEIFSENVYDSKKCCQACHQLKDCVASANLIGTCQLLVNDVDTKRSGGRRETKTDRCPLGVEYYKFGEKGIGGYARPGPCGYRD